MSRRTKHLIGRNRSLACMSLKMSSSALKPFARLAGGNSRELVTNLRSGWTSSAVLTRFW